MKKNKIYHRAGAALQLENYYNLFKEDMIKIGKSIGLRDSDIIVGSIDMSSNNDAPQIGSAGDGSWWRNVKQEIDNDRVSNTFVLASDSSNVDQEKKANIIFFSLGNDTFFLLSYICGKDNNKSFSCRPVIVYDFISVTTLREKIKNYSSWSLSTAHRWNLGITDYGGLCSSLITDTTGTELCFKGTSATASGQADDSILRILPSSANMLFFTYIEDIYDSTLTYPAIFWIEIKETEPLDTITSDNNSPYILSPAFLSIEIIPFDYVSQIANLKQGTLPVLVNMTSKISDYYAPHLYIKETPNENLFGHVQIGNKEFLAGSYFCLECGREGNV